MLSRDGVPVLIHDETLQRTTDGRGRVAARTPRPRSARWMPGAWFAPRVRAASGCRRSSRRWPCCSSWACTPTSRSSRPPATSCGTGEVGRRALCAGSGRRSGPRLLLSSFEREALAAVRRPHRTCRAACSPAACRTTGRRRCRNWAAPRCTWTSVGCGLPRCTSSTAEGVPRAALHRQRRRRAPRAAGRRRRGLVHRRAGSCCSAAQ